MRCAERVDHRNFNERHVAAVADEGSIECWVKCEGGAAGQQRL